ncbi:CLUMA_CG012519, isoform A [Clunio marinus]|uniref:CLUMA_CG012519, isoform A n=1 Tax=Clunio marinus TaxID=568069 RepID=A0A1J1IFY3_9DIPT|nr:CLUMA_CG012519, isoform A [Clunio marinus]
MVNLQKGAQTTRALVEGFAWKSTTLSVINGYHNTYLKGAKMAVNYRPVKMLTMTLHRFIIMSKVFNSTMSAVFQFNK